MASALQQNSGESGIPGPFYSETANRIRLRSKLIETSFFNIVERN
jgi:hypothetical protein